MTILFLFHLSKRQNWKAFYLQYIACSGRPKFPHLVSYNRFVELQNNIGFKQIASLNRCCLGQCTGISLTDKAPLRDLFEKMNFNDVKELDYPLFD